MPAILYGLLAIGIGLLFLFFGIRLFRTVLATAGFIFTSLLTYVLITNIREYYSWGPHGDLFTMIICVAVGIGGALLSLSMWMLALVGMGALASFLTALYVLSWLSISVSTGLSSPSGLTSTFSNSGWVRPAVLGVATVIGGLLAVVYERAIVMVATSLVGSIAISSGIDVFAQTGFNTGMETLIKNSGKAELTNGMYALLCSCAGMALLGLLIQAFVTLPEKHKNQR